VGFAAVKRITVNITVSPRVAAALAAGFRFAAVVHIMTLHPRMRRIDREISYPLYAP
jgi:hypothetical protein